ncbi:MAG: hypothetical protein ACO3A2_02305 [Bdellovibrionia bacterium]
MMQHTQFYLKDIETLSEALKLENLKEIDGKLRRSYLDRLAVRVRQLRKYLVLRDWEKLREISIQLALSGEAFGFDEISHLAREVRRTIPKGKIPRAATPGRAKEATEALMLAIDSILMESFFLRKLQ